MGNNKLITFEYGAMSCLYSIEAENKLTAYCAMIIHFRDKSNLIALYSPLDIVKNDNWLNINGEISNRLDEIFGGKDSFDRYIKSHVNEISNSYKTIKQII